MRLKLRGLLLLVVAVTGTLSSIRAYGQTESKTREPKLLAQFNSRSNNEWNKITIDLILIELSKDPKGWGYIRVKDDRRLLARLQLLRKASVFRKLDETRLTYLIGDADGYDVESFFADVGDETKICEVCPAIRAVDFDRLDKLFRLRRIARRH